jgi:nucleotide-binding universal stress UspA family protein
MKTVLIAYDETEAADRALERAATLCEAFGSELIVLSISPLAVTTGRGGGGIDTIDSPERHRAELDHAREALKDRKIEAHYVTAVGEPGEAIVQIADDRGADLIVMGTREPGVLDRVFHGSVSSDVSHHAHCDVMIVH